MRMVRSTAVGFATGLTLMAAGDLPALGDLSSWAQLGGVGIIGAVAVYLVKELAAQRKEGAEERIKQAERFDGWEHARHEDSRQLNETLTQLRENCVAARTERKAPA
jgi:hypothetical protein